MQTGTGPGKGPSVCPCLLPQHREPRNKGAILSYLMLPSPTGSARWQGHQGVSIHYPPPTPKSSGAECWGGGCSMLCCHSNQPNPQPQSTQKELSPPSLGETWVCLGIFPEILRAPPSAPRTRPTGQRGWYIQYLGKNTQWAPTPSTSPLSPQDLRPPPVAKALLGLLS